MSIILFFRTLVSKIQALFHLLFAKDFILMAHRKNTVSITGAASRISRAFMIKAITDNGVFSDAFDLAKEIPDDIF